MYSRKTNPQPVLKPQDLLIVLRLCVWPEDRGVTYDLLAAELGMTKSEVHAGVRRAVSSRLLRMVDGRPVPLLKAVREFVESGFDLMPMGESVLGFSNPWYPVAVATAHRTELPSDATIRLIAAPAFVATKLVAFESRGGRDFLASHDLEDIIAVFDGRAELLEELEAADPELRGFVSSAFRELFTERRFRDSISGHLPPDAASQARLPELSSLVERIAELG